MEGDNSMTETVKFVAFVGGRKSQRRNVDGGVVRL